MRIALSYALVVVVFNWFKVNQFKWSTFLLGFFKSLMDRCVSKN